MRFGSPAHLRWMREHEQPQTGSRSGFAPLAAHLPGSADPVGLWHSTLCERWVKLEQLTSTGAPRCRWCEQRQEQP